MQAGWSKNIVTPSARGTLMMGYGHVDNLIKSKGTELYCRSVWMVGDSYKLLYIYLDINYITSNFHDALVKLVCEKYNIKDSEIQICASHTHSAHGGYGDKLYYEIPTDGFNSEIFNDYLNNSMVAIQKAHDDLGEATMTFGSADFKSGDQVAFNRSMQSFFKNPEAIGSETRETALNLNMDQIHLKKETGTAVINWFGCHTTSIPNYMTQIHFDNKGYACQFMEEYLGPGSVAIFAQATSGDVTPNFQWDSKRKQMRGPYEDCDKNARFNGELQFSKSREIYESYHIELGSPIKTVKKTFCFRDLVSRDGAQRLGPASFGTAFMVGTLEGPGVPKVVYFLTALMLRSLRSMRLVFAKIFSPSFFQRQIKIMHTHSPKNIFLNVSDKEFAAFSVKNGIPLVHLIDSQVAKLNKLSQKGMYKNAHSWYQEDLPLQLIKIGKLLIVAVPFELTTVSGRRIIEALKKKGGFEKVILNAYANSYAGYITTPEEYENQAYEGGHTVFGRASLPILIEQLVSLTDSLEA